MNYQLWFNYFFKSGLLGFCFFVLEVFLLDIGETNPKPAFLKSIANQEEIIVGQSISADLIELKLLGAIAVDPEIITIGNSRMNNFRANMFKPYSFYNMSRITANFSDYKNILSRLDSSSNLKMIIVIIEPFMFRKVNAQQQLSLKRIENIINPNERFKDLYNELKNDIFDTNIRKGGFYGLKAHRKGRGYRSLDGSIHDGVHHLTTEERQVKRFENYLQRKDLWSKKNMFQNLNSDLNPIALEYYQSLVDYAKSRDITVVGITPPFSDQVTNGLKSDPEKYKLWHLLQTKEAIETLRSISGFYFNFSDLSSINASTLEMIDMIHMSERICAKMLLEMLKDDQMKNKLIKINTPKIKKLIESSPLPLFNIFSDHKN